MSDLDLAAFSIERRAVCLTVFRQLNIEDVLVRQLPTDERRAIDSMIGFLNQTLDSIPVTYFAFSRSSAVASERHRRMLAASIDLVRSRGIPLAEVPDSDLLTSYGHPPLRRREQLRRVGHTIWPSLNSKASKRLPVDAALLGLHVQTERLLVREGAS